MPASNASFGCDPPSTNSTRGSPRSISSQPIDILSWEHHNNKRKADGTDAPTSATSLQELVSWCSYLLPDGMIYDLISENGNLHVSASNTMQLQDSAHAIKDIRADNVKESEWETMTQELAAYHIRLLVEELDFKM